MTNSVQNRRLLYVAFVAVLAFFGLGWRLVDLQYLNGDGERQRFAERSIRETVLPAWRGDIRDRNGSVLSTSVRQFEIGVDPLYIEPFGPHVAANIAGPLNLDVRELTQLLTNFRSTNAATGEVSVRRYVPLVKNAPREMWLAVEGAMRTNRLVANETALPKELRTKLRGIRRHGVRDEAQRDTRSYPNGGLAGQLLGFVADAPNPSGRDNYAVQVGVAGLEATFQKQLAGVPGVRRVARGEFTEEVITHLPPQDGANLVLTIDRRIQNVVERELNLAHTNLGAASVFAVVLDVNTFEVLGMATAPGFDPSDRSTYEPGRARSRSLVDEYEPGSVFKLIAVAGALQNGVIDLDTPIDCENGVMSVRGSRPLTDLHGGYGIIPVRTVVAKSSNIGTAKITRMMGHDEFYNYMRAFGMGLPTGVGLPEQDGSLRPRERLYPVEFTRLPIGYGLRVTQIQLAAAYAAIANGGVLMQPRLISRFEGRDGTILAGYPPTAVRRVVSPATARLMTEALMGVTADGGTASGAALEHFTVAGKTGTAHKFVNGQYDQRHYYSSFYGFFPASEPRVCIAVTVDEPDKTKAGHYGGKVAGPIFKAMAEEIAHHLNIQPDIVGEGDPVDPTVISGGRAATVPAGNPQEHSSAVESVSGLRISSR
ncbi:MAG TPA: hypothetical protein DCY13_23260 [Verrucomicrobiales bacterium]|nr:hypothetical protein [Verrucomicrobiales bacterium]